MADPVDAAVIRAGLVSTAREVFGLFQRTAMLPHLYEARDFSISVFDDRLNLVADAPGLPEFVGSLSVALEVMLADFGGGADLVPGDVVVCNDPFLTGGHPADAAIFAPAFTEDGIVGYCGLRAHIGDLGATDSDPAHARSVFDEGLRLPPTLLVGAGAFREQLLDVIAWNSRLPRETVGNFRSAASVVARGAEKIAAIVSRFGREDYHAAVDQLLDASEAEARELIARIPDGVYTATETLELVDPPGGSVRLECAVEITGSDMTVDVSGSAAQVDCALNVPLPQTHAACRLAIKRLTTQDAVTANSGEYRMLRVIAPPGCVFNAQSPVATYMMATTASLLGEMVVTALSAHMPSRLMAQSGGHTTGFMSLMDDSPGGGPVLVSDVAPIGYGATPDGDGMDALLHFCLAGMELAGAEVIESRALIVKRRIALVPDSGGAGRFRGGLGTVTEWELLTDAMLTIQAQKTREIGGRGLAGGHAAGGRNDVVINPGRPDERSLRIAGQVRVRRGDVIAMHGAGGGGYGDPHERPVEAVVADVADGYVSLRAAAEVYGVVIDPASGLADEAATREARGSSPSDLRDRPTQVTR